MYTVPPSARRGRRNPREPGLDGRAVRDSRGDPVAAWNATTRQLGRRRSRTRPRCRNYAKEPGVLIPTKRRSARSRCCCSRAKPRMLAWQAARDTMRARPPLARSRHVNRRPQLRRRTAVLDDIRALRSATRQRRAAPPRSSALSSRTPRMRGVKTCCARHRLARSPTCVIDGAADYRRCAACLTGRRAA